jgi:hypothetical protein
LTGGGRCAKAHRPPAPNHAFESASTRSDVCERGAQPRIFECSGRVQNSVAGLTQDSVGVCALAEGVQDFRACQRQLGVDFGRGVEVRLRRCAVERHGCSLALTKAELGARDRDAGDPTQRSDLCV